MKKVEEKETMIDKIKKRFKCDKRLKLIMIVGIVGVVLLLLSGLISDDPDSVQESVSINVGVEEYTKILEKELGDILSKIDGAGKCSVMITMDCGIETIYATEQESSYQNGDKSETRDESVSYVILGTSSNGKEALVIKEIQPKVRGIIIVCEGGGNSKVRMNIIEAVSSAFDISSTKISVQKMT